MTCADFEWFKYYQDEMEDDTCPERPSTSKNKNNIGKTGYLIRSDYRLSICAMGETVAIDKEHVK